MVSLPLLLVVYTCTSTTRQTFEAVSGSTGKLLWSYVAAGDAVAPGDVDVMNLYTGQFVDDVNEDGVPDIVNMHGGDPFAQPGQFSS